MPTTDTESRSYCVNLSAYCHIGQGVGTPTLNSYKPSHCSSEPTVSIHSGVRLRVDQGRFRVFPYENPYLQPFERVVRILNPVAAVKVRSAAIHAALAHACVRNSKVLSLIFLSTQHG
jgi:hypothetical protein